MGVFLLDRILLSLRQRDVLLAFASRSEVLEAGSEKMAIRLTGSLPMLSVEIHVPAGFPELDFWTSSSQEAHISQ